METGEVDGFPLPGDDDGSDEPFQFPVLAWSGIRSTRRRVARRDRQMRPSESSESGFSCAISQVVEMSFAAPGRKAGTAGGQADRQTTGRQAATAREAREGSCPLLPIAIKRGLLPPSVRMQICSCDRGERVSAELDLSCRLPSVVLGRSWPRQAMLPQDSTLQRLGPGPCWNQTDAQPRPILCWRRDGRDWSVERTRK